MNYGAKDEWAAPSARDHLEALAVLSLRYDRLQVALVRICKSGSWDAHSS
jgi:hypothetical protein